MRLSKIDLFNLHKNFVCMKYFVQYNTSKNNKIDYSIVIFIIVWYNIIGISGETKTRGPPERERQGGGGGGGGLIAPLTTQFCCVWIAQFSNFKLTAICSRPRYFYLFGENRDWNSRDNLKIFGKVRKFWAEWIAALNFHIILKICFRNKWFL